MFSRSKLFIVFFISISILLPLSNAICDDSLDDFPVPLGGEWGKVYFTESSAASIVDITGGYVVAGRQVSVEGTGLYFYTALARFDTGGNVVNWEMYNTESDHNEALDIIARYDAEGTLTGYTIAGARHQAYTSGSEEYYNPYMWLAEIDTDLALTTNAFTYGDPWNDYCNSVLWDGTYYLLGGTYSNPNEFGYLVRADASGTADWEIYYHAGVTWYVLPEIYATCISNDGGYILATDDGIYKIGIDSDSSPTETWVSETDDSYHSVIPVTDGYVAAGWTTVSGDTEHLDLVLTKLNEDGTQAWRYTFGRSAPALGADGMDDYAKEVIQMSDGGYAVVGTTESYAWHGGKDIWVLKFDSSGNLIWDVVLGDADADTGAGIVEDENDDLVLAGTVGYEDSDWFYITKLLGDFEPPAPSFTSYPEAPFYIQTAVEFDGSGSTDPDGDILLYEWEFGDGGSGEGVVAEHTYISPGDYTVTLYVTDNHGVRRETSQTVTALPLENLWERFMGDGRDCFYDLTHTPDGGFLLCGLNYQSSYYADAWAVKLDSLGNTIWEQIYTSYNVWDSVREGIVGNDGNYLLAGFQNATVGERDVRILKVDADTGEIIWETIYDQGYYEEAFDIKKIDGGYIVSGGVAAESGAANFDALLLQLDEDGQVVQSNTYSHTEDEPLYGNAVTPSADGGYLLVDGGGNSYSDGPVTIIKTDADLTETWRQTVDATDESGGRWAHQATDEGYVIAGTLDDAYALAKLSSDGTEEWVRTWEIASNYNRTDTADAVLDEGYLIVGYMLSGSEYDVYLCRTDNEGNVAWEETFGDSDEEETGQGVAYLDDGSVVVLASNDYYYGDDGVWLFKLGGNQLPEGSFSISPGSPDVGETVTFSTDMSDPDGTISHMVWRFGDGGDAEQTVDSDITHEYSTTGTYPVRLTVVDNHGGKSLFTGDLTVGGSTTDLCPADPDKTAPGVCGCGIPDEDSDSDGWYDCEEECPLDADKTEAGVCGCGVPDEDGDGDGLYDCEDTCPADADNDLDGDDVCGDVDNCPDTANTSQADLDADGLGNACDADADGDGYDGVLSGGLDNNDLDPDMNPGTESGPAGDTPDYDGNGDGTSDADQANVSSMTTFDGSTYVTIASPDGTILSYVTAADNPSPVDAPAVEFPYGFFRFAVTGITPGGSTTVTLYLPEGETVDSYYKYGPTPSDASNHWYEFLYDGSTGAEIADNVITLHFIDGLRGDDDLDANGTLIDIGAPASNVDAQTGEDDSSDDDDTDSGEVDDADAQTAEDDSSDDDDTGSGDVDDADGNDDEDGGGGGGGCFISSVFN